MTDRFEFGHLSHHGLLMCLRLQAAYRIYVNAHEVSGFCVENSPFGVIKDSGLGIK